jgi:hypothetical protein
MKIILLTPDEAVQYWSTLSTYFEKVIEHGQGESTLTDYLRKVLNNYAQCWALVSEDYKIVGAGLTEIINYSQHKTLHIIAYSGDDFDSQAKVFSTVEEYAKNMGCKAIEQWGRSGWAKVLPKYVPGFKEAYVVMRKDLL